ncbi:hypothetical protein P9228_18600 [Mesorhizobium sp. WSM4898]|uniref:hypothetical protein n=1 Tax=Mesorhizobium sp. WSM4898 TaxID=3038544 RepID=UPI002415933A|nr:hypothetical protein [Mesorhizobium sp. WSM4898]MDG4908438.1 hypothetical protein [Mesorhizobium sp. WSM4898]
MTELDGQMPLALGSAKPARATPEPEQKWTMDWVNGQEVAIEHQAAIAVYTNAAGGIAIRQERSWDEEEDTFIVLSTPEAARRLIAAIQRELAAQERK